MTALAFYRDLRGMLFWVACFLPLLASAEATNEAVARATASLQAGAARAEADPARPIYHVIAPSPNG